VTETEQTRWPAWLLDHYSPRLPWHDQPATEQQQMALRKRGLEPPEGTTKGEACHALNKPTPKQARILADRGIWSHEDDDPDPMTFKEASFIIDSLAK
jgi:hypothetical protein